MLSAPFDYAVPESLDEALDLFGGQPDARLLAGGQSLIPTLKLRLDRPSLLIDLRKLEELRYVRSEDGRTSIGAPPSAGSSMATSRAMIATTTNSSMSVNPRRLMRRRPATPRRTT
jgi:CO/xanthine dehydrogenase FAD-binding subunit